MNTKPQDVDNYNNTNINIYNNNNNNNDNNNNNNYNVIFCSSFHFFYPNLHFQSKQVIYPSGWQPNNGTEKKENSFFKTSSST